MRINKALLSIVFLWGLSLQFTAFAQVEDTTFVTKPVQNSLPKHFLGKQPNHINNPQYMDSFFQLLRAKNRPVRVMHLGDSHVAGKGFPRSVEATLQAAYGAANDSLATSGIVMDFMARNGAMAIDFATMERVQRIRAFNPDLIIVSFGTNECHGRGYQESEHRQGVEALLDLLQKYCSQSTILITTPPGDYLRQSHVKYISGGRGRGKKGRLRKRKVYTYSYSPNEMVERGCRLLNTVAAERHLAVWDIHAICGGDKAVRNYVANNMMRPDRVHFQPETYALFGRLLGEAIIQEASK